MTIGEVACCKRRPRTGGGRAAAFAVFGGTIF